MSLKDQQQTAAKEEAERNQLPDGEYHVRYVSWERKRSEKGKDMFVIEWKIIDKGEYKNRKRKTYYLTGETWSIKRLLDVVEQMGCDLTKLEEYDELEDVLEKVEDTKSPKATLVVKTPSGKQRPNVYVQDCENVLKETSTDAPEESEEEEETPPPKKTASKGKGKGRKTKPDPEPEDDEDEEGEDPDMPD